MKSIESKTFVLLVIGISLAFAWIVSPLAASVFWSIVTAIVFAPLADRLSAAIGGRRTVSSLATLVAILLIVILPVLAIVSLLVEEAAGLYDTVRANPIDVAGTIQPILDLLPTWASGALDRIGLTDLAGIRERIVSLLSNSADLLAAQALTFGQNTFDFAVGLGVMSYLLFFLLRDGEGIARRIGMALPLPVHERDVLFASFASVIRATVMGDLLVAVLQGALGGLIFWFLGVHAALLWAVLMAILSLLPAIGAALVWLPVAVYFLVTGSVWEGVVLVAYGSFVIGLVDNVLRPILVGGATKLPDYLVLVSTLGGIEVFGLQGFIVGPVIAALFLTTWNLWSASSIYNPQDTYP